MLGILRMQSLLSPAPVSFLEVAEAVAVTR